MTNNQLTDKLSQLRKAAQNYQIALAWYQSNIDSPAALQTWDAATAEFMAAIGNREVDIIAELFDEIAELQGRNKFDQAKLINKFYERYPLKTFKGDSERAEALGYYMAGAELQRCGEFIVYEDANYDQ